MGTRNLKRYLLWFANDHVDFRCAEIQSVLSILDIKANFVEKSPNHPYWVVDLLSEDEVCQIASRSVSLRCCVELWARAKTKESLHEILRTLPKDMIKPYTSPTTSFKINVDTFCNRQSQAEKVAKIESFAYLPLEGPVKLKDPDFTLQYIEYYGLDSNNIPTEPHDVFFGRWVADGRRDLITKLSLKKRKFIGNTSMDPHLSLLMANQALIKKGDLVLDPFVGSGSLLVAAALFGAYVFGADIDFKMLHGKTRPSRIQQKKQRDADESVLSNMNQYDLESQYLDVIVADSSLPMWRLALRLDAIVTDPPYGIREATERLGSVKSYQISEHHIPGHIPSKMEYNLQEIYQDLFNFGARHLKIGGRIVCWVPIVRNEYDDSQLPKHPCLRLVANSEQILSTFTSRRLLTLEKLQEPDENSTILIQDSMGDFRTRFFRCGEEVRKNRKLQKQANWEAYRQTIVEKENG